MSSHYFASETLAAVESLYSSFNSIHSLPLLEEVQGFSYFNLSFVPDNNYYLKDTSFIVAAKNYYDYLWAHSCPNANDALSLSLSHKSYLSLASSLADCFKDGPFNLGQCHLFPGNYDNLLETLHESETFSAITFNIADHYDVNVDFEDVALMHLFYMGVLVPIGGTYSTAPAILITPWTEKLESDYKLVVYNIADSYDFYHTFLPPSYAAMPLSDLLMAKAKYFHYFLKLINSYNCNFINAISAQIDKVYKALKNAKPSQPSMVETYNQYTWA